MHAIKKRANELVTKEKRSSCSFCVFMNHDRVSICGVSNAMGVKTPFMRREVRRCLVMESHSRCEENRLHWAKERDENSTWRSQLTKM